jgi:ABC-type multidrug transport system fused ATPase/permease subunit
VLIENKPSTVKTLSRALKIFSVKDRKKIAFVVCIQVFFATLDLVGVALVGVLGALSITGVQGRAPGDKVSMVIRTLGVENLSLQSQATLIGLLAGFFLILKTVLSVFFIRKTVFFLSRRSASISDELIRKVLSQPLVKLQNRSRQQTLYAVTVGVDSITMGIVNTLILILSDLSLLTILAFGLFVVDPIVASGTFFIFLSVAFVLHRLTQVKASRLGKDFRIQSIASSEKIIEVLNSYREILVRNRRSYYATELGKIRFSLADISAERAFMPNVSKYVIEITIVLGSLLIAGVQFAMNDAAHAIAVLTVFMAASSRISPAVLRLQQGVIAIISNLGSAEPSLVLLEDLKDNLNTHSAAPRFSTEHIGFQSDIKLAGISVCYPGSSTPAVKNVSLQIPSGKIVSFVGPSGAGKTTLIDLTLGVITPDQGSIMISGLDPLSAINKWPGAIGYVPQDVMISNGTIKQNVILGFPEDEVSDEIIWDSLRTAQLDEFVKGLPSGIETNVGDRGAFLSGGQRQRLGIARAMLTKPKILVLDEATSSLDGSTEANINNSLHALSPDVTILMIAHRLSTVRESDLVVYLDGGKVIASGSFTQIRESVPDFDQQAKLMGL